MTGADDTYEAIPPQTSKYTNHNKTPDDDRFWLLMRYQLSLAKNAWALMTLTITTPPIANINTRKILCATLTKGTY